MKVFKGSRDDIPEDLKPKPDLEPLEVNKDPMPESTKQIGDQGDEAIPESGGDEVIGDEPIVEETPETPKPEVPKKDEEIQDRDAQKAYWRDKYLKLEKEKGGTEPTKEPVKEGDDLWKAKVDFLLTNKDVTEEEFDHIANIASSKDISLPEAMEQEDEYLKFRRTKVAEAKKTPAPSSTSFDTKSEDDIQGMSKADHKKLDEEYQRKHGIGRSGI